MSRHAFAGKFVAYLVQPCLSQWRWWLMPSHTADWRGNWHSR